MRIEHSKIKNGKKTYMWVYRNRPLRGTHPIVLFDWQPSRHSEQPREFLKTFSGTVVTDGYQVYHKLAKERRDLKVAGCWVHARRPFAEFIKSVGQDTAKGSVAQEAYSMITEIMHIDNTFDDLSATDRKKQRQLILSEKVDAYFASTSKITPITEPRYTTLSLKYSTTDDLKPYLYNIKGSIQTHVDNELMVVPIKTPRIPIFFAKTIDTTRLTAASAKLLYRSCQNNPIASDA